MFLSDILSTNYIVSILMQCNIAMYLYSYYVLVCSHVLFLFNYCQLFSVTPCSSTYLEFFLLLVYDFALSSFVCYNHS